MMLLLMVSVVISLSLSETSLLPFEACLLSNRSVSLCGCFPVCLEAA
jgi:hypothetical protein